MQLRVVGECVDNLLARRKEVWPEFPRPIDRGKMTPAEILSAEPGPARLRAIEAWCESLWSAYSPSHAVVESWLRVRQII